jgi:DNA-directed RNA polymerase subunit RPC12/RpoP
MRRIGNYAFQYCSSLRDIVFEGDVPNISDKSFAEVTATVWCPAHNKTWTPYVKKNYGGNIMWDTACSGHSYEGIVVAPECKKVGYTLYTCSKCGDMSHTENETSALEHSYENNVCTKCGRRTALYSGADESDPIWQVLVWELDDQGNLWIGGTGTMSYSGYWDTPWYSYCASIKTIDITDGIRNIGDDAFY